MLATFNDVIFPAHNHLLTTGTGDTSLAGALAIIKVLGHQYRWLAGGYDLEIRMVATWWIVDYLRSERYHSTAMCEYDSAVAIYAVLLYHVLRCSMLPLGLA